MLQIKCLTYLEAVTVYDRYSRTGQLLTVITVLYPVHCDTVTCPKYLNLH